MTCETQYFRFVPHTTYWMTSKYTEIKNTSDMDHFKDIVMLLLYIKLERVTWTFLSDLKEGIVQVLKRYAVEKMTKSYIVGERCL